MIALKCPHCHVGLKVDEGKIPLGITFFKCPKCKGEIPVSLLNLNSSPKQEDSDNRQIDGFGQRGNRGTDPAVGRGDFHYRSSIKPVAGKPSDPDQGPLDEPRTYSYRSKKGHSRKL